MSGESKSKVDRLDARLTSVEACLTRIETKIEALDAKLDGMDVRLIRLEESVKNLTMVTWGGMIVLLIAIIVQKLL